jgi:tetratricopeptide (TPR) repeat protein
MFYNNCRESIEVSSMGLLRTWLSRRTRGTRLAIAATAVAVLAVVGYRAYRAGIAAWHYQVAQTAAAQDDLPSVRRHLTECLREWPNDGEVNFLMARAARRDGDYATAARFLKRAGKLGWEADAIEMERALLAAQTGDFRRMGNRILHWAMLDTDERPLFLEVLVPQYLLRHDLEQAIELLTPWTEREPHNVRALMWLVEACERLQLQERAVNAARAAAAAAPDRVDVRTKCGLLLLESNQPAEARPHLEQAVALAPADQTARLGLARCLYALGETAAAIRLLDDLLAERTDDPNILGKILGVRGMVALQCEKPAEAVQYLKQALDRVPSELEFLNNLAIALGQCGRTEEAKTYLDRYEAAKKDLAEMIATTKAVAKDPRNPDLRYKAGMLLLRNGHTEGGLRWIQSALAENPAHEPSRKALAEVRPGPPGR